MIRQNALRIAAAPIAVWCSPVAIIAVPPSAGVPGGRALILPQRQVSNRRLTISSYPLYSPSTRS